MKKSKGIWIGLMGAAAGGMMTWVLQRRGSQRRKINWIEGVLVLEESPDTFEANLVDHLPDPARRYLLHAIEPGTTIARSVRLRMDGRMKPRENADHVYLTAEEMLNPPRGFVWKAHLKIGPVSIEVVDFYTGNEGAVDISVFGAIPVSHVGGVDVTRSSRHRLAAESVWIPSALLPGPDVTWEPVDDSHARVSINVDGEKIPITLTIDEAGRLKEVTMHRYGDVKVDTWQLIPYGFSVEEEKTFSGFTIPSRLRGGWWYGTDRYEPEGASSFQIRDAVYR